MSCPEPIQCRHFEVTIGSRPPEKFLWPTKIRAYMTIYYVTYQQKNELSKQALTGHVDLFATQMYLSISWSSPIQNEFGLQAFFSNIFVFETANKVLASSSSLSVEMSSWSPLR